MNYLFFASVILETDLVLFVFFSIYLKQPIFKTYRVYLGTRLKIFDMTLYYFCCRDVAGCNGMRSAACKWCVEMCDVR